jgi:hypothetical protein
MSNKTGSAVQYYIVVSSLNHHCHSNATIYFTFVVGVDVAIINIKGFSVAMERQQWVPFMLQNIYAGTK